MTNRIARLIVRKLVLLARLTPMSGDDKEQLANDVIDLDGFFVRSGIGSFIIDHSSSTTSDALATELTNK